MYFTRKFMGPVPNETIGFKLTKRTKGLSSKVHFAKLLNHYISNEIIK